MLPKFFVALFLLSFFSFSADGQQQKDNYLQQATNGIHTLQTWYSHDTGLYQTTGWWNAANSITVLANYARLSGSKEYQPVFANTFQQAQETSAGFLNDYCDDEGWWALAWIDVYDLTHERQYLTMARAIFTDMSHSWDGTCGGGIWWSKDRKYKNAIANELFLSVAAHLAARFSDPKQRAEYLDWAHKEWAWFSNSGMINAQHLINDGLDDSCKNNQRTTWTYNQGVILGGLSELNKVAPDPALPAAAQSIATAAIEHLADANGVLHDTCEPNCGADGEQFKGIFMRNLMDLEAISPDPRYRKFFTVNAASILKNAQGPNHQFGEVWSGPFKSSNAAIQTSALEAILAAAAK
ncbi:glycoside hydrolase family 76 protein [Acidobacterium sp. S8]|uniref:glycoside hydrolase family 76 protein n=1 Tax=Acidobacterium sp. S8 TaxID=1641854 RepID=UPI00131CAC00|nr:glycoside hydrolase family 76 protein [Acidobacterium sp. S8]